VLRATSYGSSKNQQYLQHQENAKILFYTFFNFLTFFDFFVKKVKKKYFCVFLVKYLQNFYLTNTLLC